MLDNNVNTYVMKPITVNAILVSKDNVDSVIKFLGDSFVSVDQNSDCILFNQFGLKGVLTNAEYYLVNSSNSFHVCRADTFISTYEIAK
ncbi:MAG: hypothetical protein ACMV1B_01310 [Prevotella sp.]